jgi:TP53 regulating kinase-like protein
MAMRESDDVGPEVRPFGAFQGATSPLCDCSGAWQLLKKGAEASVWAMSLFGQQCVAKVSEPKTWRIAELDTRLRSERLKTEARTNMRCVRAGIAVARVVFVDPAVSTVVFERLDGPTLKDFIATHSVEDCGSTVREVGTLVAKMHGQEIVHSDLTTSNMMIHRGHVHLIDFGLSYTSVTAEDRAVDLYVLEKAFVSSHPGAVSLLDLVWEAYQAASPKPAVDVFSRLKKVRARGRKRSMEG